MRIATRGSELALWQAHHVADLLRAANPVHDLETEIVVVSTTGDRDKTTPLHRIGGKGVFVKEVQAALFDGRADLAVHSAKDMPAIPPDGLVLGAVPERADPRDVLVGGRLADLGPGAIVGTGSVRRRAQLAALRPDLVFDELRGNMATRLDRASDFDAIVVAAAALDRLGARPDIVDVMAVDRMVPQVGQGTLAVECRADDRAAVTALAGIEHAPSRRVFDAERAFLRELGGDCSLPAGAHGVLVGRGIELTGFLAAEDLDRSAQITVSGIDGPRLGAGLAVELLRRIERIEGIEGRRGIEGR